MTPRCLTLHVNLCWKKSDEGVEETRSQNVVEIEVPKGQILFVQSAVPIKGTPGEPYMLGACYDTENIMASVDAGAVSIVRGIFGPSSLSHDQPGAGFKMAGGAAEKVHLCAVGADFWVVAWVGYPSKIPGLGAGAT